MRRTDSVKTVKMSDAPHGSESDSVTNEAACSTVSANVGLPFYNDLK